MNGKIIDFRTKEQKRADFKEKLKQKCESGKKWWCRNKDWAITIIPVAIGGLTTITKVVGKRINLHKEETLKEMYCYDRSLGHYWRLKRDLSNKEWLDVDRRKKNGERLADILAEMKVLK